MALRFFSYGGGVQSTAALVLAARGEIDFPTFEKSCHLEATLNERRATLGKDPVFLTRFGVPLRKAIALDQDTLPADPADGSCDSGWCFL